jgi:hypothetical protein
MVEIDLRMPMIGDAAAVIRRVDSVMASHGLSLAMKGSVKSYPGATHWHWKNGQQPGTLEMTYWPANRRLWLKVQAGRKAKWIGQIIPKLRAAFEMASPPASAAASRRSGTAKATPPVRSGNAPATRGSRRVAGPRSRA